MELFATCAAGLEGVLAAELEELGVRGASTASRGVAFEGGEEDLFRVSLASRIATRLVLPLETFSVGGREDLHRGALEVDWGRWIGPGRTIAVDAVGTAPGLTHTGFVAQVVKDGVCDRLRRDRGDRPTVDRAAPDVPITVRLADGRCTVGLDATGPRLHRRGYRREGGEAPLKETLAAGVLALAGFRGDRPVVDPMCGSGTFLIEAALAARRIAPGLLRLRRGGEGFAFQRWPGHDAARLDRLVAELEARALPRCPAPIAGSDSSAEALETARRNARRAGVGGDLRLERRPMAEVTPAAEGGLVVTNPPYGARLGAGEDLVPLYRQLGDVLKARFAGHDAWVLVGDLTLSRSVGLRTRQRITLWNGPIECRLLHFELYGGTRRR